MKFDADYKNYRPIGFVNFISSCLICLMYSGDLTGDQGFLNSYFPDFANARIFDPHASEEELKSRPVPQMERLSTIYNADVGLYMLANKVTFLISK